MMNQHHSGNISTITEYTHRIKANKLYTARYLAAQHVTDQRPARSHTQTVQLSISKNKIIKNLLNMDTLHATVHRHS